MQIEKLLTKAALASTQAHKEAWRTAIEESIADGKEMGVTYVEDVDRDAFRSATQPLVDQYSHEHPRVAQILRTIDSARG
ncbi:hypothetical protein [Kineosphaera limosa]|uniref:hypothetical protein n=1 Tax=Kineosphaera limosa TaxID=111564 RepID=UPI0020D0B0B0|nr:hypothetical protein [Kineosphaera limosa]